MFGKYLLFELKNSYKFPAIAFGSCLIASLLAGITISVTVPILNSIAVIVFFLSMMFAFIAILSTLIQVFGRRLFSHQGYLTLTLPIKTNTIIFSKVLVCFIYMIVFILTFILMIRLFLISVNLQGAFAVFFEILKALFNDEAVSVIILLMLNGFIGFVSFLMVILTLNSLRHMGMAKSKRTVIIIAVIIGYIILNSLIERIDFYNLYYVSETKSYLLMTNAQVEEYLTGVYNRLGYTYNTVPVFNILQFVYYLAISVTGYFVSKYIIESKLDLY